ncbi:MAG: preprotein translocase subunit YajC [Gammaproteobacteria bacterium]|nr:preprotein translocase subunit YajC [Gammaproteobacteria bacterium]
MDSLLNSAFAQSATDATSTQQGLMSFLPLVILFVAFYFFLIRPQMNRQRDHQKIVEGLHKGDEVVITGGMLGRISDVGDNYLKLEVAKGIEVKVQKQAVATVLPKGTIKEI